MKTILYVILSVVLLASCSKSKDYKCMYQEIYNGSVTYEKEIYTTFETKEEKEEYERQTNQDLGASVIKVDCEKL
jgi:hypothetical protein